MLSKWWIALICFVVGALTGFIVGHSQKYTTYTLKANYVVYYKGDSELSSQITGQTKVANIIAGCITILDSNRFYKTVASGYNGDTAETSPDYLTWEDVQDCMTFTYSTTSMSVSTSKGNVIYVTVTTESEKQTLDIMTITTSIFSDYIKENYNMAEDDSIMFSLANDVDEPEDEVNSDTLLFTAVGGVGCAVVSLLVMAIIVTVDQRVKSEEELTDRYGITVLGSIPDFEDKNLEKGGYYHGYKYEE
jgi:uncharacterized protein involved in exopolysaccharide biosynthesis